LSSKLVGEIGVAERSPTVEVDCVRLAYSREGRGPAVVCLHAIGHGGRDFDAFAVAVRDRFEVIRIDWPGQGRSGRDHKPPSAARYAELLGGALAALKIEGPILLGNSIGGAAALIHAARHPVKALVLCNTGGLIDVTPSIARACRSMARFFDAGVRKAWWFKTAFRAYYRFLVLPSPAARAQRTRIIAAAYDIAEVLRDAWLSFATPDADIRALALKLDMPVWVAWATGDRIIQLKACLPTISKMKRATLTKFGGGHAAFLERPRAFAKGFKRFAASLEART
jgi:4,5:9,10-diseco-3-hydroxy-5,9,17-trioxoandrosta-1(10),2-diene-4-oate hydrolase